MKTAFDKLSLILGKHKTFRLPLEKELYKFNKQQINNELRPNDFKKGVFITQKTKPKTTTSCDLNILTDVCQACLRGSEA